MRRGAPGCLKREPVYRQRCACGPCFQNVAHIKQLTALAGIVWVWRAVMIGIQNMDFATAGEIIRKARKEAGLTQAQLAKRLGMGRSTISLIESGMIGEIGVRKYANLCDLLGLVVGVSTPPRLPTLNEVIDERRRERAQAFAETDSILGGLRGKSRRV